MTDGAENIVCVRTNGARVSPFVVQSRRPGAPLGNQNRLIHGRRSKAFIERRKKTAAILRASALAMSRLGFLSGRCRCRPLRPDQLRFVPDDWIPIVDPQAYVSVPTRP